MRLSLIERYIFRKASLAFLAALSGLIGVIWVVRAVQEVDVILNQGQGIFTYLKMTTLGVPTLAAAIAPLALLLGLIRTINGLNADSELVVIHASGASRVSLMKPFIALALLVTILVYFLHLWAGPTAMSTLRTYITKARADLVSLVLRENTFRHVGKGMTFHIAKREPGGALRGVFILDGRNKEQTLTYLADQGNISKIEDSTFLVLQDGEIHRQQKDSEALSIIKFDSYAFNLSSLAGGGPTGVSSQTEISTYNLFFPDPNDPYFKAVPERVRAELHVRLTGGLYPLMVCLLLLACVGNPSSHRQGQNQIIVAASLLILVLRGATIAAEGSLRNIPEMAYVMWGIPLIAIVYSFYLLFSDKELFTNDMRVKTERLIQHLSDHIERALAAFNRARRRRTAKMVS